MIPPCTCCGNARKAPAPCGLCGRCRAGRCRRCGPPRKQVHATNHGVAPDDRLDALAARAAKGLPLFPARRNDR